MQLATTNRPELPDETERLVEPAADGASVTIARRYVVDLQAPLGQGGMAMVYRGRDLKTRRDVALKTLRAEYRDNPETRARFRQEIRRMAFLDHPNVAKVFDLLDEGEAPWAVLEFVPGRSLKEEIADRGALPPADVAELLDQIAAALEHVHDRKLVHLDIKPQNLLLTPDGLVKLIDFGLAQPAGSTQELIGGTTFGTAAYLSPEQAAGEPVERSADVYALGCVVYELLTGQPPFLAESQSEIKNDVIRAHIERDPVAPSKARRDLGLTAGLDEVVLWALAKNPAERFTGAVTFANIFRGAVDSMGAERGTRVDPIGLDEVPWGAPAEKPRLVQPATRLLQPALSRTVVHADGRRPLHSQVYRLGGRVARRTGWLRSGLWRLTAAVALANLLLALGILSQDGPDGLLGREPRLEAGADAQVVVDELLVRDDPGTSAVAIAVLADGADLEVTGEATSSEGMDWWPVRFEQDDATVTGYVWSGGISADHSPGLIGGVRELFERIS